MISLDDFEEEKNNIILFKDGESNILSESLIYFDSDSYRLNENSTSLLNSILNKLNQNDLLKECVIRNVSYKIIADVQALNILNQIASPSVNQDVVKLEKPPKIAIFLIILKLSKNNIYKSFFNN